MATIRFYNSLSRAVEEFSPIEPGKVGIYNCGPTVYKRQHIGNMRRFLFSDFLRRTLELFGYEVRDITNITDVGHLTEDDLDSGEDKLERQARAEEKTPQDIADEQTKQFLADLKMLNIEAAHMYPRATAHIQQMQDLIARLLEQRLAYQTASGIYFDVQAFPHYGKLSGNTLEAIEAGARVEVRSEKKHPADFALWIFDDGKQIQRWPSPWGEGYPGWHIECSAMSMAYLGDEFDIHTGGEDNKFPHHENEIAQSVGATGKRFAHVWMHNGHLQIGGAKLAKREGEQITLDTIVEKGFSPLAFRLLVFGSHYRSKMDFSWEALTAAQENLEKIKQLLRRLHELLPAHDDATADFDADALAEFQQALGDDLNTPLALAAVMQYITQANSYLAEASDDETVVGGSPTRVILHTLREFDRVLGVVGPLERELEAAVVPEEVRSLAQQREEARLDRDFERADALRVRIEKLGYVIEDTDSGPRFITL